MAASEWEKLRRTATRYKEMYPPGTRVVLNHMEDPWSPVPTGTRGTVAAVDAIGQIHMKWDNGRSLALVPGVDSFRKLTAEEIAKEELEKQQATDLITAEDLTEQAQLRVCVVIEKYLGTAAGRGFGRFDVAGVGDQPGLIPGDQDEAVREGKACGIALVLLVGQQKGVEPLGVEFFLNLQNVVHIPVSSDVGRGKLTMKTEPCGLLFPTRMLPPQAVTASCTMLSPRPLPPLWRERALSTR